MYLHGFSGSGRRAGWLGGGGAPGARVPGAPLLPPLKLQGKRQMRHIP
ncbi:MAG: hypothetical protein MJE68_10425 [Proteobacteria bacterium]|nr:hypothetical protein [Pseudomonadota bacterium]